MLRFFRYIFEILAALLGIAVVCGILLAWRLSSAPITPDFLTPYIESGLETAFPENNAKLENTQLSWDARQHIFKLRIENTTITDKQGVEIAAIPSIDVKISALGLLFGQFMPRDLTVDHPQIKLERDPSGSFAFGGLVLGGPRTGPSEPAGKVLGNLADDLSDTLFLHKLEVRRAVIDIHDQKAQQTWSVSVPEVSIKRNGLGEFDRALKFGALDGRIKIDVPQANVDASLDVHYLYDPVLRRHSLTSVFSNVVPAGIGGGSLASMGLEQLSIIEIPLSGKVDVVLDKALTVTKIGAQVHADEGRLVSKDFWDKPCVIKSLDLNAKYDRMMRKLTVSDTRIDFGGPTLELKVTGTPSSKAGHDLDFTTEVKIDRLPMNKFADIWPKPILPNPRDWLTTNLHNGAYDHAEAWLKGSLNFDKLADFTIDDGGGKVAATKGQVTYVEGMPPVQGVDALATFDLKKMDVQITNGGIGSLRLSPFTVQITGLAEVDQYIDIPMSVSGPLPEVLRLLDHPPLGYAKALGLAPDDLGGKMSGQVKFRFPLLKALKMKDVDIQASATATEVASTKLIPGIPLDQGNLALALTPEGFNLKGQINVGKAPFNVVWDEAFEQKIGKPIRHVTATGSVREDQWANLGITAFAGTKGMINVTAEMTKPSKAKTILKGSLDLTPAAFAVDMVKWKKPANVPAVLKFTADAAEGQPVELTSIMLRGTRVSATGKATLSPDMSQLISFSFPTLILGRTNASLDFKQSFGEDGKLSFDAKGASLDVSGLRGGNDPDKEDPRPKEYHIKVDKLYTSDIGEMDKVDAYASRDKQGWRALNLHGIADGDTPLSMELTPKADGTRAFAIICDNFGKAMKGLGFTDTIKGGKLTVYGKSTPEAPRIINGTVKIKDFTVQKLPVLALLLNATSPFGLPGILTDSADFALFKGQFVWKGDAIQIKEAHVSGNSVGINIEGDVDMNSGDADLKGTLVPFSIVNNVLNAIPLIGDLITGGEHEGVLAVSYTIDGKLDSPNISVNPISLLTPGFLRNLFFGDDDSDGDSENGNE
jgi:hypothetical protein